jgi:hypothetical protein
MSNGLVVPLTGSDVRRVKSYERVRSYEQSDPLARMSPIGHMSRDEYLQYFKKEYKRHHKTAIGPTQRGKTTETIQTLKKILRPDLPCVLYSAKPSFRDPVITAAADYLHLKVIEEWPPVTPWLDGKRGYCGYLLRPFQTMTDQDKDDENIKMQFKGAMRDCYATRTPLIEIIDEAHRIQNDFGLKKEYERPLMSGLPDCMVWSNIQRGRFVSYLAFDAPEWILFYQEPDHANTLRYAEMVGGVNRFQIADIVENLRTKELPNGMTISDFLLVRRAGPKLFVVSYE